MFSETEIAVINNNKEVQEVVNELKLKFLAKEAEFFEIETHDFLALIFLSTAVGKAMANNHISFAEEMSLQKKARKLSKGGFFLSKDPVADGMKYLIKSFDSWEEVFYKAVHDIFLILFKEETIEAANNPTYKFEQRITYAPYLLVRFLTCLFLETDDDVLEPGRIRKIEFDKLKDIGNKTGFSELRIFTEFLDRFEVK